MKKVNIEVKDDMRVVDGEPYETVGDYYMTDDDTMQLDVLDTGSDFTNRLIAIHELCEQTLLQHKGVSIDDIDVFDLAHADYDGEPGDLPDSPYRIEHAVATCIELILCAAADVDWCTHDATVCSTYYNKFNKIIAGGSFNPMTHLPIFREILKKMGVI